MSSSSLPKKDFVAISIKDLVFHILQAQNYSANFVAATLYYKHANDNVRSISLLNLENVELKKTCLVIIFAYLALLPR
jgi:hypothetical protein